MARTNKRKVEKIFAEVCEKYNIKNRQFTKADFYRICEGENIVLWDMEEARPCKDVGGGGAYLRYRDMTAIILRSFFQKWFDRFTAYHELGHHFCGHIDWINLYATDEEVKAIRNKKSEAEADYFSFLATGLQRRGVK